MKIMTNNVVKVLQEFGLLKGTKIYAIDTLVTLKRMSIAVSEGI